MHQKIAEAHRLIAQGHALLAEAHSAPTSEPAEEKTKKVKKADTAAATPPPLPATPAAPAARTGKLADEANADLMQPVKDKLLAFAASTSKEKALGLLAQYKVGKLGDLPVEQAEAFAKSIEAAASASAEII